MEQKYILPEVCVCGNLIGCKQKLFEEEINRERSKLGENITEQNKRDIQNDAIIKFGWNKMCCRVCFINACVPFIRDSNTGSYIDTINITKLDLKVAGQIIIKNGPEFIPTKNVPEFPSQFTEDDIDPKDQDEEIIPMVPKKKVLRLVKN